MKKIFQYSKDVESPKQNMGKGNKLFDLLKNHHFQPCYNIERSDLVEETVERMLGSLGFTKKHPKVEFTLA